MRLILIIGAVALLSACGGSSAAKPTQDARPTAAVVVTPAKPTPPPQPTSGAMESADTCKFVPPANFASAFSNPAYDYGAKGRSDGVGVVFRGKDSNGVDVEIAVPLCAREQALKLYNQANGKP